LMNCRVNSNFSGGAINASIFSNRRMILVVIAWSFPLSVYRTLCRVPLCFSTVVRPAGRAARFRGSRIVLKSIYTTERRITIFSRGLDGRICDRNREACKEAK
jgi:hypothetical protein